MRLLIFGAPLSGKREILLRAAHAASATVGVVLTGTDDLAPSRGLTALFPGVPPVAVTTISGVTWRIEHWLPLLQQAEAILYVVDPQCGIGRQTSSCRKLLQPFVDRVRYGTLQVTKQDIVSMRSERVPCYSDADLDILFGVPGWYRCVSTIVDPPSVTHGLEHLFRAVGRGGVA